MIHIFYRHYNVSGREDWRPHWFDYEKCIQNLIRSINNKDNVNITIIYDGEKDNNFIFKYDLNFLQINANSDYESFKKTLDFVKKSDIKDDDIIYLLENDYLHINGWDVKVIEFFENLSDSYLSLYDHNDKYFDNYSDLKSKIIVKGSHHYRTTPSTCGSFLSKKKTLVDDYHVHYYGPDYSSKITNQPVDHSKFILLNTFKGRNVFTPIPGLSTHCLNGLLSPTIKWEEI